MYSIPTGYSVSCLKAGKDCRSSWSFDRCYGVGMDCLSDLCKSVFELNNTFTDNYQVDRLQTNGYDCGVWVLASIAAVLRGFDVMGFSETDIPWFRQFIMYHVLSLPISS
jgi:hypothetical protein